MDVRIRVKFWKLSNAFVIWMLFLTTSICHGDNSGNPKVNLEVKPNLSQYTWGRVTFTCNTILTNVNVFWYQVKGNHHKCISSKNSRTFNKTVEFEDHNTSIYCILWKNNKIDTTTRYATISQEKQLCFREPCDEDTQILSQNETNKSQVTITPLIEVPVKLNQNIPIVCKTSLKDGIEMIERSGDKLTALSLTSTNLTIISSLHNTSIYCVGYDSDLISFYTSKTNHIIIENFISNDNGVLLLPQNEFQDDTKDTTLYVGITVGTVIFLILAALLLFCIRKRRQLKARETQNLKMNDAVTYADLEVLQRSYKIPKQEDTPYAEIIGVLKPKILR